MKRETWPVFTLGLVSLFLLILIPGSTTVRRTDRIQSEIRRIQGGFQDRERSLDDLSARIHRVSIDVRDFLLDSAPDSSARYRAAVESDRKAIDDDLMALGRFVAPEDTGPLERLKAQLELYWQSLLPVFEWSSAEKSAHATYFLREQQRPRRENLLAIANELARLNLANFQRQYDALELSLGQFRDEAGRRLQLAAIIGFIVAFITVVRIAWLERRSRRHQEATEAAEQQLRDLSTRLMTAQEQERRAISRELHDEVGQMVTALRMELGSLERVRSDDRRFQSHLNEAKALAENTMRTVRELARGLRPSLLDDLGLGAALNWQARELARRTGKNIGVEIEGDAESLADSHRTCLYRVLQEALTNCVRHSGASDIRVRLTGGDGEVVLSVEDNGSGISGKRTDGLGMRGMEERVREVGGTLVVASEAGHGTKVTARIPFKREVAAG